MFYYLYQITNKVNGKIYVGVHKTKSMDDGYMGSGKVIKSAIQKHGIDNFEKVILETFEDSASMYAREKEVVTSDFLSRDDVYNLRRGGCGGFDFINANDMNVYGKNGKSGHGLENLRPDTMERAKSNGTYYALCERISLTLKDGFSSGRLIPGFLGKTHSDEARAVISKKSSETQKGSGNSQYGSFWITDGAKNMKCRGAIPEGWRKGRKTK